MGERKDTVQSPISDAAHSRRLALSYSHPLDRVVMIFYFTDKQSGSKASYKSLGMHRVSFTLVCVAESRL